MSDIRVPITIEVPDPPEIDEPAEFECWIDQAEHHRDQAVRQGFSPEAAEAMAVQLHSGIVARYFTQGA